MTCCGGGGLNISGNEIRVLQWNPTPNAAGAPLADGVPSPTATGTATARAIANPPGNYLQTWTRIGYVSAAVIDSVAGARPTQFTNTNGNFTPTSDRFRPGRWSGLLDFGISDAFLNPEARMFVGWQGSIAAPTAVDPATLTDMIGIGHDNGETNLRFYSRDNAGATNEIDLGAGFPVTVGEVYRLLVRCDATQPPGAGSQDFTWRVIRASNGVEVSGRAGPVVGTVAPRIDRLMAPRLWRATGPTNAAAVGIDLLWMKMKVAL